MRITEPEPKAIVYDDQSKLCRMCGVKARPKYRTTCSSCYYPDYYARHPEVYAKMKEYQRTRANRLRSEMSWEERAKLNLGDRRRGRNALSLGFLKSLREGTPNCECCGILLDYGLYTRGQLPFNRATIDKIIPALGYVESNVAIICWPCNRRKDNLSLADARMIVDYIERKTRQFDDNY